MFHLYDSEHSRLVYLLDALRVAPQKAKKLIDIIDTGAKSTDSFKFIIEQLRSSPDIIGTVKWVREMLL